MHAGLFLCFHNDNPLNSSDMGLTDYTVYSLLRTFVEYAQYLTPEKSQGGRGKALARNAGQSPIAAFAVVTE